MKKEILSSSVAAKQSLHESVRFDLDKSFTCKQRLKKFSDSSVKIFKPKKLKTYHCLLKQKES